MQHTVYKIHGLLPQMLLTADVATVSPERPITVNTSRQSYVSCTGYQSADKWNSSCPPSSTVHWSVALATSLRTSGIQAVHPHLTFIGQLHWLPVCRRVEFKLSTRVYRSLVSCTGYQSADEWNSSCPPSSTVHWSVALATSLRTSGIQAVHPRLPFIGQLHWLPVC